jgi:hypothetical protein
MTVDIAAVHTKRYFCKYQAMLPLQKTPDQKGLKPNLQSGGAHNWVQVYIFLCEQHQPLPIPDSHGRAMVAQCGGRGRSMVPFLHSPKPVQWMPEVRRCPRTDPIRSDLNIRIFGPQVKPGIFDKVKED